jgi:DNA polymerase III subunit gamma/tau
MFGAVESVIDAGHDPRRFATDLLERFRDLLVLQAVPDAITRGVVDAPEDVLDRMREQATRIGPGTLTRYAEVVHAGLTEMRGATAPRLLLEVICARLLLPSASDAESALLQRVERIETRLDMSIPLGEKPEQSVPVRPSAAAVQPPPAFASDEPAHTPAPAASSAPAASPPPEPSPAEAAGLPEENPVAVGSAEPTAAAVRTLWPTVRDKVRQRSRTTEVMLAGATVRAVEGNTLVLTHESAPLAKRLSEQRNADVIAEALKDALGVDWRVRCEAGPANPAATEAPTAPARPAERGGGSPARRIVPPPVPAEAPADVESAQRDEEESMLAEAGQDDASAPRRDPEEAALELLQNELGARRIDNG